MNDMNDSDIRKSFSLDENDINQSVLNFLFNIPIEKIQNQDLRVTAITTRQSFEILRDSLFKITSEVDETVKDPISA